MQSGLKQFATSDSIVYVYWLPWPTEPPEMLGCKGLLYANETEDLLSIHNSQPRVPIMRQMTSIYTWNPISLRTTLVLLFHLRPGLPNNFFLSDFPNFHVQHAISSLLDPPGAILTLFLQILTCICLTAGVNLLTPSGHRQIRDVITPGIDMCRRRMRKGGGGVGPYIRRGAD